MATDLSLLLILVFTCCFSNSFTESRKELRTQEANQENVIQLGRSLPPNTIDPSRVTELSWQPRVFLYKGFLSDEECDHLISLGNDNQEKPSGNNSTKAVERTTNFDLSLAIGDEITARIEERISAWTFLPKGNGMPFQVLHYGPEKIKENHNYLGNTFMRLNGESVIATIVMYLSNVTQGGQILFPGAESRSLGLKRKIWSDCRKSSETTKPIKGNAILFFNLHPNASLDPSSLHARCAIVEGDMWWATKIFVVKSVAGANSVSETSGDDGLCTDEDDNCPRWAAVGECDRNPIFMVGSADYYGTCRKSCNVC
ncbi:probable prolyl 4-hydroxylase 12 isoform X1 [Cynara cardunculus var. scolymus]|uniref:probable prolyl 4-hydroxylase 12 isoform X1 n=1 Tax=Cynara cardunculus var. scolymus TaxID=59895 RepID=UPI000D62B0EC|nr:probable prolyl 4-hydroxylase 12 isoform X1 [Cynara cardunculus var. scolymus]